MSKPEIKIQPYEQFKLILGNDLLLLSKNYRPFAIMVALMILLGYYMGSDTFASQESVWVYRIIMIITGYTSRHIIS